MRHPFAPLCSVFVVLAACTTSTVVAPPPEQQGTVEEPAPGGDEETPAAEGEQAEKFGAPIDPSTRVVPLADVLADPESFKDEQITTSGNVRQVCQKRGCWAEIRPDASADTQMRVTFKGYAFFLPKDSKGSNVKVEGRVSVQLLGPDEVAHLEAEGATFKNKKPDGSAISSEFVASGVEMTGRKK